jgi:HTH-type transcriptional regulator / antitoxin HigA
MEPKVIKTEAEHRAALSYVATLMDAAAGSKEEADLELWSILIDKFEEERFPIAGPDPVDAICFRMDQLGLTRSDLLRFVRSKSKVSEILGRKRPLSLNVIRAFHAGLGIPTDVLIQPMRSKPSSPRVHRKRTRSRAAA